jgi:hypothetical protein
LKQFAVGSMLTSCPDPLSRIMPSGDEGYMVKSPSRIHGTEIDNKNNELLKIGGKVGHRVNLEKKTKVVYVADLCECKSYCFARLGPSGGSNQLVGGG